MLYLLTLIASQKGYSVLEQQNRAIIYIYIYIIIGCYFMFNEDKKFRIHAIFEAVGK
jgi:hypothetical protein